MGSRGPVPKSQQFSEPRAFPVEMPRCPSFLDREAKAEWARVVPHLEAAGILATADRSSLASYCLAWSELVDATKVLNRDGRYQKKPIQAASTGEVIGHAIVLHPAIAVQKSAFNRVKAFLAEFGLSPAARARLGLLNRDADDVGDDLMELLQGRGSQN